MTTDDDPRRKVLQSLCWRTIEEVEADLDALEMGPSGMDRFRTHALLLRDEGATHVTVGDLSVTFGPKPQPPLTAEAVAQAIASKTPEPEGDDAYLP